jgi:hypothetical protein
MAGERRDARIKAIVEEINARLVAIVGTAYQLRVSLTEDEPRRDAQNIELAARRIAELVAQLDEVARTRRSRWHWPRRG